MSAFCVFGVTIEVAAKKAKSKVSMYYTQGPEVGHVKPRELYEQELADETEANWQKMRPLQVSPGFDAPQFAQNWLEICRKTVKSRNLVLMAYVAKKDAAGNIMKTKSGHVQKEWVVFTPKLEKAA